MTIFAVDPGKEGTGVAALYDNFREADQFKDPKEAFQWVAARYVVGEDTLLVESYLGSGHNTAESKETLKVIGLFQYGGFTFGADDVVLRAPQLRLSGVAEATEFVDDFYPERTTRFKKDAISALAHAITFRRHLDRTAGLVVEDETPPVRARKPGLKEAAKVRVWCREQGIEIGTRGAIPRDLLKRYREAQS